jgi:hypothetical protein
VLNYLDTLSGATAPGQSIKVEIVTPDYHPNPQTLAENQANVSRVLKTFTYTNDTQVDRIISELAVPSVRFKINLHRELNVSSPAVEHVYTVSNAYYKEYKTFGTGDSDLRGYGSAVYGQNTGVDKVYTNGVGRTDEAKISSLSFTVPSGAENPDYVIEVDPLFSEVYTAEEVDIYWNSNSSKMTKLEGALTDDYLVVKVSEPKDAGRVKRHYRYGSGLATTIYPSYLSTAITNTFSPSLEDSREYAYYIMNGFTFGTPNNNLSIRWSSENEVAADSRRNVTYSIDDFVFVSIITSQAKNLVDWISEEKKFDAIVNNNDVLQSYTVTLTYDEDPAKSQIPEIESDVIVNSDPTIIPYKVEVIEGSVFSHGTRKSESVITPTVRYIYSVTGTPSLKEQVEEKIMVIRTPGTNVDRLPKAMVKKLNGTVGGKVLGVYSNPALYMPDFTNKINPTTGEENETGDYKYYAATGTYNNAIDWAPAIAAGTAPDEGSTYYVSYVYDKVISLRVELACDYSEYEPTLQIYKSPTITHSGECMPMADYISDPMAFTDFTVPADVDRSTLRYVVYDNSSRVRTYVDDNRVVGTLDSRDPKVNRNPNINGGYYYINKDSYYMFVNPVEHTLDNTLIPIAKNVSYTDGYNGTGILIEEGTTNLAPSFSKGLTRTLSFSSSFAEEGLALTPTTWDELGTLPVNTLETRTWNELEGTV